MNLSTKDLQIEHPAPAAFRPGQSHDREAGSEAGSEVGSEGGSGAGSEAGSEAGMEV